MYGKIFSSMYEGTLFGQWEAIVTLQQFIVLADEEGVVDMTPPAIAAKTSIPLEIIEKGIETLSQPDKYSRSPKDDGRRIKLLDDERPWGWQIVNYRYYRDLATREEKKRRDRERIAEKRKKDKENKDVADCREPSQGVNDVAHTDRDTNTEREDGGKPPQSHSPACPHNEIIDLYHEILPELPAVRIWEGRRRNNLKARWRANTEYQSLDFWRWLFGRVRQSEFLMERKKPKTNLEWIVGPENFISLMEGKYHDADDTPPESEFDRCQRRAKELGAETFKGWGTETHEQFIDRIKRLDREAV